MSSGLKGWHPGEAAIQSQLQYSSAVKDAFELFANSLPVEQRAVHSQLILLPLAMVDHRGRPWVSLLTSPTGAPGFVSIPAENIISVEATPWDGDPLSDNLQHHMTQKTSKILIAGAAVNLDTVGPRNKFSGFIKDFRTIGKSWSIVMEVNQSFGNCNRYLSIRGLDAHADASPVVEYRKVDLQSSERLPDKLIKLIHRADTAFFGTSYVAAKRDEKRFPSHLGLNHRGGNPGFLRVRPTDGRTIVFPDYSGSHIMNSLGNIEATPVAALTIPCLTSGDILYLTGTARNFVGKRAQALMHRVNVLTTIKVTGYVYIRDALPFREHQGTLVRSPYCPPIRLLTEERPSQTYYKEISVKISQIILKTKDIATFTFETSKDILVRPGEWAMLDFSSFVGRPVYPQPTIVQETESRELNDDRIRTWTVSSLHSAPSTTFEITMQRRPDGLVTTHLFNFAHNLTGGKLDSVVRAKGELPGQIQLVSTGGDFKVPDEGTRLLWIAGGIGITPFISLLQAIQQRERPFDVTLLLVTRLPDIHISLFTSSLSHGFLQLKHHRLTIHLYSRMAPTVQIHPTIQIHHHETRFNRDSLLIDIPDVKEREVSICTPSKLSDVVLQGLIETGADVGSLRQESFMW